MDDAKTSPPADHSLMRAERLRHAWGLGRARGTQLCDQNSNAICDAAG